MGSQILELKWANHKSNMTSELQELYLSDALFDVTIACGEYTLKAHKTVLSASSTFFRKLFVDNPCKHPILIMTDIDFGDLKAIVEFMYQGEIHVAREKLSQFLKIAEKLMVKGLSSIENINLNPPGDCETGIYPHYSSDTREQGGVQLQLEGKSENVKSNPTNPTDSVENGRSEEMPVIKLEDDVSHPDSGNCMYWESEHCDQTSSVVIPDYNLSDSSASHQLSFPTPPHKLSTSSVSHQLLIPTVSHQLSPSPTSHEVVTVLERTESSSSRELGVPLSGETFTHSDNRIDSMTVAKLPEESTGIDNNPVNLFLSQDQPSNNVPTSTKSFETRESSNHSSQDENTKNKVFTGSLEPFPIVRSTAPCVEETTIVPQDLNNTKSHSSIFNCKFCSMFFVRRDMLEKHLKTHSKFKKFICGVCNKYFSTKYNLQTHQRVHTGEKPYVCKVCNKQLRYRTSLRYHEDMHRSLFVGSNL